MKLVVGMIVKLKNRALVKDGPPGIVDEMEPLFGKFVTIRSIDEEFFGIKESRYSFAKTWIDPIFIINE